MSDLRSSSAEARPGGRRIRAGLRRHGVIPRPAELRRVLSAHDLEFSQGNSIELFRDGISGLTAMLAAIQSARRRVHLETYIFHSDSTGLRFIEALTERASAGVEVRLLFDAVGSRGIDHAAFIELRQAGGVAVSFNPIRRMYPQWAPRRRDHRKILVVDGEVAFTGGLNIGDEYFYGVGFRGDPPAPWNDAHVRVTGPAVAMLGAVFLESWFRADAPDRPSIQASTRSAPHEGGESVAVLADGPTYHRRRMRDMLVTALERAQQSACLATPYFVPGRRLRAALASAAQRGVDVELVIAGYVDHPAMHWAARALLPGLIESGVRVYEYERSMMHAKAAVFDETHAIFGTSNLDRQSLQHSYEVNLLVNGGTLPGELLSMLRDFIDVSRPMTARELLQQAAWQRMRNRAAAFILNRI